MYSRDTGRINSREGGGGTARGERQHMRVRPHFPAAARKLRRVEPHLQEGRGVSD